jgi:DNA-binding NarL/FixJ family response regulator
VVTTAIDHRGIVVTVHSADPLTRAGALNLLRYETDLQILESPGAEPPGSSDRDVVAVLMICRLDDMAVSELRRLARVPGQRVVLVAERLRDPELVTVLESGARTILWREEVTSSRLAGVVRVAARGESRLPPDLLGQLITHVGRTRRAGTHAAPAPPATGLDEREVVVLKMLADGLQTREIAEKLAYSERTIKNVLSGVTTRLQLKNRSHAVAYALREGYI